MIFFAIRTLLTVFLIAHVYNGDRWALITLLVLFSITAELHGHIVTEHKKRLDFIEKSLLTVANWFDKFFK